MMNKLYRIQLWLLVTITMTVIGCDNYFKNDYVDNSPTSGKLKVYYDEGLRLHVLNQILTFESQYRRAHLEPVSCAETEAIQALYKDSCELIVITRPLSDEEKKAFASKNYFPRFSAVAKSGIALITNINTPLSRFTYKNVIDLLTGRAGVPDSAGNMLELKVLFDRNNSSVIHYLQDTVLKGTKFSDNCNALNSTLESINYVADHRNTVAFIDYAWLSDSDDSISRANKDKIKLICVSAPSNDTLFEYPNQSSFKLGNYPFSRTVYVYRKTGDFSLAKGFESFVAGPKGQLTFLKQGLLPGRQGERSVKVNTGPLK